MKIFSGVCCVTTNPQTRLQKYTTENLQHQLIDL